MSAPLGPPGWAFGRDGALTDGRAVSLRMLLCRLVGGGKGLVAGRQAGALEIGRVPRIASGYTVVGRDGGCRTVVGRELSREGGIAKGCGSGRSNGGTKCPAVLGGRGWMARPTSELIGSRLPEKMPASSSSDIHIIQYNRTTNRNDAAHHPPTHQEPRHASRLPQDSVFWLCTLHLEGPCTGVGLRYLGTGG